MEDINFGLILAYYNRPNMVLNALESIRDQDYNNWHLTFIDDGWAEIPGGVRGEPIVKNILGDRIGKQYAYEEKDGIAYSFYDKATFCYISDTPEKKIEQKGSRHPFIMNFGVMSLPRDEDVAIIICEDDLLCSGYLRKLNEFYKDHPDVDSSYCHVIPFDPFTEKASNDLIDRVNGFWLNHGTTVMRYCRVDSTQVTYRKRCFTTYGCAYHSPWERASDADLFGQLDFAIGPCSFNGIIGQFKGTYGSQLSFRVSPEDIYYNVKDLEEND